ncbi:MAG: hypothetical protein AB7V22_06085 [Kiritimatiellia bacterium]
MNPAAANHPKDSSEPPAAERRWLRRYGAVFPLAGIPLGLWIGRRIWQAVLLVPPADPGGFDAKGLALGLAIAALPLAWLAGLALERRWPGLRRWPAAPALAALLVLLADGLLRTSLGQSLFWQAVLARSGQQHLAREISLFRLEAADQAAAPRPGLVLAGSSQLVYGIDGAQLSAQTGQPVHRRAAAGMFPTELVASQGWFDFHPDNRLVLMVSGFDLGARRDLYPEAIRPLATVSGLRNLLGAARARFLVRHWRALVDLGSAAACELWRSRDYARFLLAHPFQAAEAAAAPGDAAALAEQKDAYGRLGASREMVELGQRALARFFADMAGRCRQIVVFEGRVSPAYPGGELADLSREARDFLIRQQAQGTLRFIPLEEQGLDLPEGLWRDLTHVGPEGRRRLTEAFARALAESPPPKNRAP